MQPGLNSAQILDRARNRGVSLSNQQVQEILSQAWDSSIFGADPGRVDDLIKSYSSSAKDPVLEYLKSITKETTKRYEEYHKKLKEFDEANPYNADEWLVEEREMAAQRLDPYYDQTLSDYLRGVETTRDRSLEDRRTLLDSLQADTDYYQGRSKIALEGALERSREGFAGAGLYESGASLRNEGQITEEAQAEEGDFLRKAGERRSAINTRTDRTLDDLLYNEGIYRRDLGRERSYNIESSAQSEVARRTGQHAFERSVYAGAPPGANPVSFDTYTYSLLR